MEADVLVAGGGPAGASMATRLAQFGHRVVLVDARTAPPIAMAQTVAGAVRPLLDALGAHADPAADDPAAADPAPSVARILVDWDGPLRWRDGQGSFAVLRPRFDAGLRQCAARVGALLLEPARLIGRARVAGGWRLAVRLGSGEQVEVRARLLVEATGRRGRPLGARMLALHGWWRAARAEPVVARGMGGCWAWALPLGHGRVHAVAFQPAAPARPAEGLPDDGRRDRRNGEQDSLARRYQRILADALPAAVAFDRWIRDGPVAVVDATARLGAAPAAPDLLRVGDAALALDPLSSSGVLKAIQGAGAAAAVANTLLEQPWNAALACRFHADSIARAAARHQRWSNALHAGERGGERPLGASGPPLPDPSPDPSPDLSPDRPLSLSPEARIELVPVLLGSLIAPGMALVHPALEAPVAHLGNRAIAPLLARVRPGQRLGAILADWSGTMPAATAAAMARWAIAHRILV